MNPSSRADRSTLSALAAATLAVLALWVWQASYTSLCAALLLPLGIAAVLTLSLREKSLQRRACIADCWFRPGSLFHRLLRSPWLITLGAALLGLLLGLALCLWALEWSPALWGLMAADAVIVALAYPWVLRNGAQRLGIRPGMDRIAGKQWLVAVNAPLLVLAAVLLQLHSPLPAYLDPSSFRSSLEAASAGMGSTCAPLDTLTRLHAEKEAALWWLLSQGSAQIHNQILLWLAWLGFLVNGALGAWAWARLCTQLADFALTTAESPA